MKTYYDFIIDYLIELDENELLNLWNEYCFEEDMDSYIHYNDEYFFEENFLRTDDAVRVVCYGDYRYRDTYVVFNGYGNLESFDSYKLDDYIYLSDLANYLEYNGFLEDEYSDHIEENQEV